LGVVYPADAATAVVTYMRRNMDLGKGTDELLNSMNGGINQFEYEQAVQEKSLHFVQYIAIPCLFEHSGLKSSAPPKKDILKGSKELIDRDSMSERDQYRHTFKRASMFDAYSIGQLQREAILLRESKVPRAKGPGVRGR
jgi:hypothetical protein